MLNHPSIDKLNHMKLHGMAQALMDQLKTQGLDEMSFDERLGLMVDREYEERAHRGLKRRLQVARLRYHACLEDLDYTASRGLDRGLLLSLAPCGWVKKCHNVLITGATGVGKSYVACALGHRACMEGLRVMYFRTPRLLQELTIAKGDGRYPKLLEKWKKIDLLILDDWGLTTLGAEQCRDLLEILEDRYQRASTLVTSQMPFDLWHKTMKSPTLADAILDRLFHEAYRIQLKGESRRRRKSPAGSPDRP